MGQTKTYENRIDLTQLQQSTNRIIEEISKVIIGQEKLIKLLLVAILADGHVLIEGVPGVAKTLSAKLIAKTIQAGFSRIQFTPDLMPADILGTTVYNMKQSIFEFNKGPVFSNIILIDEINRAPAKTQSALFEVMEERQVSIDGTTYQMDKPFLVFATQNPIEHEGTYRLPEAQLDRFLFKLNVGYPTAEQEETILMKEHARKGAKEMDDVATVINATQIIAFHQIIKEIHIEEHLIKYISKITEKTRNNAALYLGASPRAALKIMIGSKAYAAIQGRDFVTPEDIQELTVPILGHRLILTPEKEMEGLRPYDIVKQILEGIEVPR